MYFGLGEIEGCVFIFTIGVNQSQQATIAAQSKTKAKTQNLVIRTANVMKIPSIHHRMDKKTR